MSKFLLHSLQGDVCDQRERGGDVLWIMQSGWEQDGVEALEGNNCEAAEREQDPKEVAHGSRRALWPASPAPGRVPQALRKSDASESQRDRNQQTSAAMQGAQLATALEHCGRGTQPLLRMQGRPDGAHTSRAPSAGGT